MQAVASGETTEGLVPGLENHRTVSGKGSVTEVVFNRRAYASSCLQAIIGMLLRTDNYQSLGQDNKPSDKIVKRINNQTSRLERNIHQ